MLGQMCIFDQAGFSEPQKSFGHTDVMRQLKILFDFACRFACSEFCGSVRGHNNKAFAWPFFPAGLDAPGNLSEIRRALPRPPAGHGSDNFRHRTNQNGISFEPTSAGQSSDSVFGKLP